MKQPIKLHQTSREIYRSGFNVKYHNEDQSGALTAGENLTFTSLDESIAVVSSTGLISVPSEFKLGETTIRIATDDGLSEHWL